MLALCLLSCQEAKENSQGENFNANVNKVASVIIDDSDQLTFFDGPRNPIAPKFQQFPSGSVMPKGWIPEMMTNDLESGIVGALDELYPGIKLDDLYNTARRGGMEDIPEMGDLVLTGAEWEQSIMWWNSETTGNWWDGFIRHAFMTGNKEAIQQTHSIINNLLISQGEDGYIGIYKPNLRYQHEGSNGELWAQTTAFRTMLAYYEFTQNEDVLNAVENGMALTMKAYSKEGKNPFDLKNAFGGVTHGLMLTDVCETLYRITEDQKYQDYATYLYRAFSTFSINRSFNDLRYPYLKERDSMFEGHGVHTYEHIRTMVNAYYNTGYPELELAYDNMLYKLDHCLLPSGAGHADEWILKLNADPNTTAAEYCGMLELRNSYGSLLQKTGEVAFADAAEKLTYNAMLGARNADGTALTYSKFDNCHLIDGKHHEGNHSRDEPRYKYSPTHSEPAVCCVPNYTRNLTYFLDQMWMKASDGIAATMYGPSILTTDIDGSEVSIEQVTNYPLSDDISFKFLIEQPLEFSFYFRKPEWATDIVVSNIELQLLENGFYVISKEWQHGETVSISFKNEIQLKMAHNDEAYFQKGPLVYAYEIPHTERIIKSYDNSEFTDYYCFPDNDLHEEFKVGKTKFKAVEDTQSPGFYKSQLSLKGQLIDANNKAVEVELVPMGKTVLRRVTFPKLSP